MRLLPVIHFVRKSIYLLLVAVLACDSYPDDFIKKEKQVTFSQTEFFTLPASSIVIDLKSLIKKSFVSASLTIAEDPLKGTLTQMDDLFYKYTPNYDFTEGQDQFIISAVLDDGTTVNSTPMIVYMKSDVAEFPCGLYAVEDDIRIDPKSTIVIHVLRNDRICEVEGPVQVLVHLAAKFGEAVVVGGSIKYTPGPAFSKGDELVYSLSTSNGEEVSFGLVSINKSTFEILEIPGDFTEIFFVDDMTGFIAGGRTIQKTIDGGRHWIQLAIPAGEDELFAFDDIYFLDKDNGFAAFLACPFSSSDEFCAGGWMMTKNGGVSWERFDLKESVNSIIFTSPLVGYISTSSTRWVDFEDPLYRSVFKTVDGGETWDQVGELDTRSNGTVELRFATDDVGWAYQNQNTSISSTTDGGKTWEVFFTDGNGRITSLALASDNVICASVAVYGPPATAHSSIVRSENAFPFQPVINFPYIILSQGFSPEGDLGVAVGRGWANDCCSIIELVTISISTDKGKTWADLAEPLYGFLYGFPRDISVPSANVAYILCDDKIIKYSP